MPNSELVREDVLLEPDEFTDRVATGDTSVFERIAVVRTPDDEIIPALVSQMHYFHSHGGMVSVDLVTFNYNGDRRWLGTNYNNRITEFSSHFEPTGTVIGPTDVSGSDQLNWHIELLVNKLAESSEVKIRNILTDRVFINNSNLLLTKVSGITRNSSGKYSYLLDGPGKEYREELVFSNMREYAER